MCWNKKCFSFESLIDKKVSIFICGPGYLEFPWAFETAMRAKKAGAIVEVVDISNFAEFYAQRIYFMGLQLPWFARKLLRALFLKKHFRIEFVLRDKLSASDIKFTKINCKATGITRLTGHTPTIDDYKDKVYGLINVEQLLYTVLSGMQRQRVEYGKKLDKKRVKNIEKAIYRTVDLVEADQFLNRPQVVFVCNGRMPVQAILATYSRAMNKELLLYEGGGGYIYPNISKSHIDYFFTSPHNKFEHQEKIECCFSKVNISKKTGGYEYLETIRKHDTAPYNLDWIPRRTSFSPSDLNLKSKDYFVYYSSSDYELSISMGISKYKQKKLGGVYQNQIQAVRSIIKNLPKGTNLVIRLHPRDPGIPGGIEDFWSQFYDLPHVQVISHESPVDSYQLGIESKGVMVWDSTIGFELAVSGLPVATLGNASYARVLNKGWIKTDSDLRLWMQSPASTPTKSLLKFAIYLRYSGFPITFSKTLPDRTVYIEGVETDLPRFKILQKLAQRIH